MSWTKPEYSKSLVDKAGASLAFPEKQAWDRTDIRPFDVIGNFRSSHGYALNSYQMALRSVSKRAAKHHIVAQRLKRIPSIIAKLRARPGLRLTQIQDIGGCRSIVDSIQSLKAVRAGITSGRLRHKLLLVDDYIEHPKPDGYRSLHLIFAYHKASGESPYENQKIEVQVRTNLQHAWATAVETVDLFSRHKIKSGKGPKDWERFFRLVGSAFAELEGTVRVPECEFGKAELQVLIRESAKKLGVFRKLTGYQVAVKHMERVAAGKAPGFVLVRLNFQENMLHTKHYAKSSAEQVNRDYIEAEIAAYKSGVEEVALVGTDRVEELRKAYPNYYLDTQKFVSAVRRYTS